MVRLTIQAASQYILNDGDWEWLQQHFGVSLPVLSLSFAHDDGRLFCISVLKYADDDKIEVITLFPDQNQLIYKLEGLDTTC